MTPDGHRSREGACGDLSEISTTKPKPPSRQRFSCAAIKDDYGKDYLHVYGMPGLKPGTEVGHQRYLKLFEPPRLQAEGSPVHES